MKNYRSELIALFGDPVDGNPTGVMVEAAFADKGLDFRYITMKVTAENLEPAMKAVVPMNLRGLGVTMPHKVAIIPYLNELSPAAGIIGAVNTVLVREDGTLFGENTDGKGFVQALKNKGVCLEQKNVTIFGAGGAAKAIAVECALAGARSITIINRTPEKAEALAKVVGGNTPAKVSWEAWQPCHKIPEGTDILINGTSIGLHPHGDQKPDIDYDGITANMVAADVVFNPVDTGFLTEAAKRGALAVDGLGMLACQGVLGFELWTGVTPSLEVMETVLKQEFAE